MDLPPSDLSISDYNTPKTTVKRKFPGKHIVNKFRKIKKRLVYLITLSHIRNSIYYSNNKESVAESQRKYMDAHTNEICSRKKEYNERIFSSTYTRKTYNKKKNEK